MRSKITVIILAVLLAAVSFSFVVVKFDADLELYYKLKEVPNGNFADEEILKSAKAALDTAVVE